MNIDETNAENPAIARPKDLHQHGTAGAAHSMTSPAKAGSQRPRADQQSPVEAPPRATSRLSDDEVLDYASTDSAGAAGASTTPNALAHVMEAAASAIIPALNAAAKKRQVTAAKKAAKAELRKAAARKKTPHPQPGAAGAPSQPTTLQTGAAPPPELPPVMKDILESQVQPPLPPRPPPRPCAPAPARWCTLMALMTLLALILYAGPVWRGGESRCNRGLGLSRGSPLKRHKSHRGSCLQAVPPKTEKMIDSWTVTAHGCQNAQDGSTLQSAHPLLASRTRATSNQVRTQRLRISGRLDSRFRASRRQEEHEHTTRGCVHFEGMLRQGGQTLPRANALCAPAREAGGFSGRIAHTRNPSTRHCRYATPRAWRTASQQCDQPRLRHAPRPERRNGRCKRAPRLVDTRSPYLIAYHWHTTNILWIRGRLPWIIPGRHA